MPISGPSSYLPTIDAFIAHWTNVNVALGPGPLKLGGTYTLANLTSDRTALATKITAVDTARSTNMSASTNREILKAPLKERIRQFNALVRGVLRGTVYAGMLPKMPGITAGMGKWQVALDLMLNCWTQINADAGLPAGVSPLQLTGSYVLATFTTDRTALLASYTAVTTANENYQAAVQTRDSAFALIRQRLVQYRPQVEGMFASGNALLGSIPALTPARGTTPDPVALTGTWDAGSTSAHLVWTPTADPRVTGYEVRACFNQSYRTADESVLDPVALGTTTYATATGLGASGAYVTYKVYTLTATGNEKGSNSAKVTRP